MWSPLTPYVMLSIGTTLLAFESIVLVALLRLAKKNPTFVLLSCSGIAALLNTLNYTSIHAEYLTGWHTPFTRVEYSRWATYSARVPGTAVCFIYFFIAINRCHAIIMPLHYRNFWTMRLTIFISLLVWLSCFVVAYFGTFYDDPHLLAIHNMDSLCFFPSNYRGQALGAERAAASNSTDMGTNYNLILGWSTDATTIVYAVVFIHYASRLVKRRMSSSSNGSAVNVYFAESNKHIRLMLICFGLSVGLPYIVVYVIPFIEISVDYQCIFTDVIVLFIQGSEAIFLLTFSTMVRQQLPGGIGGGGGGGGNSNITAPKRLPLNAVTPVGALVGESIGNNRMAI